MDTLIQNIKAASRKILSPSIRRKLHGFEARVDFRVKTNRKSATDYVAEFNHRNLGRAKKSILWHDDWDKATEATFQIVDDFGLLRDGHTVVDYGCGIGRISNRLLAGYQLDKVLAVDRSEEMLRHARDYVPAAHLQQGRLELLTDIALLGRLDIPELKLDLILFIEVLHHIPAPVLDRLVPKLMSRLSPEGKLFVLGNNVLDVDAQGNESHMKIEEYLPKHVQIIRQDVWNETGSGPESWQFYRPRYSFLCAAK